MPLNFLVGFNFTLQIYIPLKIQTLYLKNFPLSLLTKPFNNFPQFFSHPPKLLVFPLKF
ncbi:hypothetical protein HanXRQr2_Chr10g0432361 [Helianthus annuus]|uniref:Uncharacterized protein n=1 Tax=Helianthus annuus TaxID=4232 RepID=A0A251TK28_HELAN|nr:hypothetical protein HanXRQr2_Chr10g0432361 [Helianthus annuus]KAJ0521049.1 hypothetical protein HanIR_Chr10g0466361 [Helianthus annuus]